MQALLGSVVSQFNPQKEVWDPYKYRTGDLRYRRVNHITQNIPESEPVMDLQVNPVKDFSSHFANVSRAPTFEAYSTLGNPGLEYHEKNDAYCNNAIPSSNLTDLSIASKELMGLNQAQRTTLPAGSGVPAYKVPEMISPVNELTYGNKSGSGMQFNKVSRTLYNQNFVSMSAVPSVPIGEFVDPLTGIAYETYESAIPPPDADYYEMTHGKGKDRKFAQLQGGWSQNVPMPEKREILEGDFYMKANRTINTYGGEDSYGQQVRAIRARDLERQMRFTFNDARSDGLDGPILTGVPANTVGIYGTEKVRYVPRLPSTHRGYQEEVTFRSGVDPSVSVGHETRSAQQFTSLPQCRLANDYQSPAGPAFNVDSSTYRAEVLPQNTQRGTEVYESTRLADLRSGGVEGTAFRAEILPQMTERGTEVYEETTRLPGNGGTEATAARAEVLPQMTQNGMEVSEESTRIADNCETQAAANRGQVVPQLTQNGLEVSEHSIRLPSEGGAQAHSTRAECTAATTTRGTDVNSESIRIPSNGGALPTANRGEVSPQTTTNGLEVFSESTRQANGVGTQASSYRAETLPQLTQRGTEVHAEATRQANDSRAKASSYRATVVPQHTQRQTSVTEYKGPAQNFVKQGQTYAKSTRKGKLTMLKRIYGAMSNNCNLSEGTANRSITTQMSDKKTNPNTAIIPSRSIAGTSNMFREPDDWVSVQFNPNHTPSTEYIGNAHSNVSDSTYVTPNMPLKAENDMWRMPTPSYQIGGAHEMIHSILQKPQSCPVTY